MPSSFTSSLRLTLPATGENSGIWGDLVNTGITNLVDTSVAGYASIAMTDANYTLTTANGAADQARSMMLNMTGTLTAAREVICPTASKLYFIKNATTGGFAITLKTSGGTGISIPNSRSMVLMCDGVNVREAVDFTTTINTTNLAYTGTLTGGTGIVNLGSGQFYKDASGNVGVGTITPAVKLDVIGAGDGGLQYRTGTRTVGIGQTASEASVYWGSTTPLTFFSGSERMRIDANGNVGIGVTPSTLLHLKATTPVVRVETSGDLTTTATSYINFNGSNGDSGYLGFGAGGSTAAMGLFNRLSGPLVMATANTERMRIDSSGDVRIGTTTALSGAGEKLSVNVNSTGFVQFMVQNNNSGYVLGSLGQNNLVMYPTAGGPAIGTIFNDGTNVTFDGTTSLRLSTANVERIRIDSNGNQINTPSNTPPTLTVNGQMNLTPTSNTNMRISYRGSDGVTRVGNITLA